MITDNEVCGYIEMGDYSLDICTRRSAYNTHADAMCPDIVEYILNTRVQTAPVYVCVGTLPVTVMTIRFQDRRVHQSQVQIENNILHRLD